MNKYDEIERIVNKMNNKDMANDTADRLEELIKKLNYKTREEVLLGKFPNILAMRVPTSPELVGDGYSDGEIVYDTWICPNCKQEYEVEYEHYNFCPYCGQCIDWDIESGE